MVQKLTKKVQNKESPRILLLDIDLTLNLEDPAVILKVARRLGYPKYGKKVWKLFEDSARDLSVKPNPKALANYDLICRQYDLVYVISSRVSEWRRPTKAWLNKWGFYHDRLLLRKENDYTTSSGKVKEELVLQHIVSKYENPVVVAIDDDNEVCEVYKSLGFKVFKSPKEWDKAIKYHRGLDGVRSRSIKRADAKKGAK